MNKKLISNIERKRLAEIKGFLKSENIPLTSLVKIKGDASFRVYYRIKNTDLVLMDANPRTNEKISSFIKIQKILSEYGINVPKIYKKDVSLGLMIIQDLGKKRFVDYVNRETILGSMDILSQIHSKSIEMPSKIKNIKKYTLNEQMKETDLFFSWYLKKHLKKTISKKEKDSFKTIFKKIYKELNIRNYCLVLRDFHVDNIIPMPGVDSSNGRDMPISSMNELGLIDFQDALVGSPAYDFSSFIDDVRSPIMPPVYSSGVITSTFMIGSSNFAPALRIPSRIAIRAAISKARTELSTSWNLPSINATLKSITGKPAKGPL